MLHDFLKGYLREVERTVVQLDGIYVERYEEENSEFQSDKPAHTNPH